MRSLTHMRGVMLPIGGVVGGSALAIAAYTAHAINRPPARNAATFTFTPWELGVPYETVHFVTEDGVTIRGWWMPRPESTQVTIGLTGHYGRKSDLLGIGSGLWRAGSNVLLFDFRGCGDSDRASRSLAHNELPDARAAIAYVQGRLPDARIGMVGYSMGAAIAILTAAHNTTIGAVVADSSFASTREVIAHAFGRFRVPPYPIVGVTDRWNRWRYGYSFSAVNPLEVVSLIAPRPLLLIHGEDDRLVPVEHARRLAAAAGTSAELWISPDTTHCGTYFQDRERYVERVAQFLVQALQV